MVKFFYSYLTKSSENITGVGIYYYIIYTDWIVENGGWSWEALHWTVEK